MSAEGERFERFRQRFLTAHFEAFAARTSAFGGGVLARRVGSFCTESERDRAVAFMEDWRGILTGEIRGAQAEGAVGRDADVTQLAFEVEAYLFLANAQFVVRRDAAPIELARRAIEKRLAASA